jgi:hypothetical protein
MAFTAKKLEVICDVILIETRIKDIVKTCLKGKIIVKLFV